MLTNKITGFSADLLNTVRGILGEAKKCPADCECEKCEAEEMKEGSMPTADEPTDANKKTADKVRAMLAKEKKLKEDIMEMVNEASDGLADKAKKSGISLSTLKKVYARGIAAWNSGHRPGTTPQQWAHARVNSYITKGKGTYHGADKDLRSEGTDMPFEGPYKKVGDRKDEYGNKVKNVAKYLAKKAMNKQKNEEVEQVDEISSDMAYSYLRGKRERDYDISADGKSSKLKKPQSFSKMNKDMKSSMRALRTIEKAKKANEEAEHNNCDTATQIDEISAKTAVNAYAKRNAKAFNDGQYDDEAEKDYNKLDKQGDRIQKKFGNKIVQKAQKAASKKIFGEEIEDLDETAKIVAHLQKRYGDNIRKSHVVSAANDFGVDASKLAKAVRAKLGKNMLDEEDDGWYTHSQMHGSKKSEKHPKGISAAEWKSGIRWHYGKNKRINIKEEVEQIDELSKGTMGRYINKAKDSIDTASYRQGHKEAHGSSSKPLEKKLTKRHKGISTAVSKLTKEEEDFVDSLNNEIFEKVDPYDIAGMIKKAKAKNDPNHPAMKHVAAIEDIKKHGGALSVQGDHVRSLIKALGEDANVDQIDELSKDAMLKYLSANKKDDTKARETGDYDKMTKRMRGTDMAVRKYTAKPGSKYVRVPATEEVELDEARGRPRKAGAKDFTIHPKTKEKLMHNNPEHMKKIEVLQKNGILEKPKVEAGQHIMNQLRKAKTSMLGGSKINFTHGDSKEVSGTHAAKILTKYAGMKPDEKENFQKFVGHSHENLMKHV